MNMITSLNMERSRLHHRTGNRYKRFREGQDDVRTTISAVNCDVIIPELSRCFEKTEETIVYPDGRHY